MPEASIPPTQGISTKPHRQKAVTPCFFQIPKALFPAGFPVSQTPPQSAPALLPYPQYCGYAQFLPASIRPFLPVPAIPAGILPKALKNFHDSRLLSVLPQFYEKGSPAVPFSAPPAVFLLALSFLFFLQFPLFLPPPPAGALAELLLRPPADGFRLLSPALLQGGSAEIRVSNPFSLQKTP